MSDWTKIASRADFTYVYTYISDNLMHCSSGFLFCVFRWLLSMCCVLFFLSAFLWSAEIR